MNNLKKAKKIINVNYCFENGDELEIPFVYKPDVMKYINYHLMSSCSLQ